MSTSSLAPASTPRDRGGALRPPGPAGGRLLGSLRRLRDDPLGLFTESSVHGDIVGFRAAHLRVYLVIGEELIRQVEIGNRDNYVKGVSYEPLRISVGQSLLTADGEDRVARRKMLSPHLSRRTLLERLPVIGGAVEDVADRWEERALSGKPIDVTGEMNALAFDIAGRVLVGAELGDDMRRLAPLMATGSAWVARRTRALAPLPLAVPTPANVRFWRIERTIRRFVEQLIARRAADPGDDVVSKLVQDGASGEAQAAGISLRDELIGLLLAGFQTTGAALAWCWYLLGLHPEVDRTLAAEAAAVVGGRPAAPEDLGRLAYTRQTLMETMRLYPPGWAFTRTAVAPDELGSYRIPAGSMLVVSSYANHRNPRFWSDPDRFDPERFGPDEPTPGPCHYFPFGVGPHVCVGKHLAMIESTLAIASLAARFRLELVSPAPVRAEPAITLTPRDPILARVHERD